MTPPDTPRRTVAHIGAFDLASYGDQLYPLVAAAELGRRLDDVEVLPFGPLGVDSDSDGPGHGPSAATWALGPWSEARAARLASQSSLVLCGGGEIVYGDGTLYTPFYDIDQRDAAALGIDRWFIEGLGAAESTCPLVWHAPGVPTELDEDTAARVRQAVERRALVAVRDDRSRRLLEAAGVERAIDVVPDSALLMDRVLEPAALDRVRDRLRQAGQLPAGGPIVVVQGNNTMTPLAEDLAGALDELAPGLQIVTVSVSPCHGDDRFAEQLRSYSARRSWDVPVTASLEEVTATIAGADCFLGVSLHGAITALAYDRPSVTYDPFGQAKLAGFVELAGIPESRTTDPAATAELVARYAEGGRPGTRRPDLQRRLDAWFDQVAELVDRSDRSRHLDPVTWADTATALQLGLRRLPRPVAPAPATRPPALRRPSPVPTLDELATAVHQAMALRRAQRTGPDEYDELLRAERQAQDLRGALMHLEGVLNKSELTEAELRVQLADSDEVRRALQDVVRQARASRLFRYTGHPRSLGDLPEPD